MAVKKTMVDYMQDIKSNELYTPYKAVEPLFEFLPKNKVIWGCTDFGESNITKFLRDNDYQVITSHKDNFDFLNDQIDFEYDMIITNPPYTLKDEFLRRCYELGKPFALLLPLTALEGVERDKMYNQYGLEILVLDRRINFMKEKKSNWFNTSWFCNNILPEKLLFRSIGEMTDAQSKSLERDNGILTIYDFLGDDL